MSSSEAAKAEELAIWKAFKEAEEKCTVPWVLSYSRELPGTDLKLHHVLMILGGIATAINILVALFLLNGHLKYWVKPREQKQYVRIIFFLIFLSITTFLSLTFYNASGSIDPIGQYYEGFAIVALYLLYCNFTTAEYSNKVARYEDVKSEIELGNEIAGRPAWLKRSWALVFQVLITRVATLIAAEVLFDTKCALSKERIIGQLVTTAIQSTSTGLAVAGVIGYEYRTSKRHLQGQQPALKLIAFKGVVIFQAIQEILFRALGETQTFLPTPPFYISYNDFVKGFPDIIFLWELTAMALLFLKAFNATYYREQARHGAPIRSSPAFASLFQRPKNGLLRAGDGGLEGTVKG